MTRLVGIMLIVFALMATAARAQICTPSVSMVAFGMYDPLAQQPTDSIATVTVTCTGPAASLISYHVVFAGSGARARELNGTKGHIEYQLYTDPARTRIWGDCSSGGSCISDSYVMGQSSSRRTYAIYSRMLPHQQVLPGTMTDNVMVLLNY